MKGTIYFEDGHTEEITSISIPPGDSIFIDFHSESGHYAYFEGFVYDKEHDCRKKVYDFVKYGFHFADRLSVKNLIDRIEIVAGGSCNEGNR